MASRAIYTLIKCSNFSGNHLKPLEIIIRLRKNINLRNFRRYSQLAKKTSKETSVTFGEKVKQGTKDVTYGAIVVAGLAVTGTIAYFIGKELLSGNSPNGVYSRAMKLCKQHHEVQNVLGKPIKGYGEMNSRGRRRFPNHARFQKDGVDFMRMQFYLEGPRKVVGTVLLEAEVKQGKFQFNYIAVELNDFPRRTIMVEDNR